MASRRSRSRNNRGTIVEEPEIVIFDVPTCKPKTFKAKSELRALKNDKPMDLKIYKDRIDFCPVDKRKVKRTIDYAVLQDVQKADGSPELMQLITKTKCKKVCYQIKVDDEANRNKLWEFLETRTVRGKKSKSKKEDAPEAESNADDVLPRETETKSNKTKSSKNQNQVDNIDQPLPTDANYNYEGYEEQYSHQKPIIRNGGMGKSRSTGFNLDYVDDDDDDYPIVHEHPGRAVRRGYLPRYPESSYYSRSRISVEPEYVDDDYVDDDSNGYDDYDDSEYSEETVVVRPMKPRSLTFYTPFLKVPQSKLPYYS